MFTTLKIAIAFGIVANRIFRVVVPDKIIFSLRSRFYLEIILIEALPPAIVIFLLIAKIMVETRFLGIATWGFRNRVS
jgi:hypothetical protein